MVAVRKGLTKWQNAWLTRDRTRTPVSQQKLKPAKLNLSARMGQLRAAKLKWYENAGNVKRKVSGSKKSEKSYQTRP